jgi:hypothetical protein
MVIPAGRDSPLRADFEIRGRKFLLRVLSLRAPTTTGLRKPQTVEGDGDAYDAARRLGRGSTVRLLLAGFPRIG